jgi:hypothetical protein
LKLGPDDGPIAISPDGTQVAVSLPDHGAVIESINSNLPLAPSAGASAAASSTPSPAPSANGGAPRRINSGLHHVDDLGWSPNAKQVALAVNRLELMQRPA